MNGRTAGGRSETRASMIVGSKAVPVYVEVAIVPGIRRMTIVGMPDAAALEACERVRCAVKASGYEWPDGHIVVNLAPSSLKKHGGGFDLAIAVAVLVASGQVDPRVAVGRAFVGELGLDGAVRPVRGMLCHSATARESLFDLVCSAESAEASYGEAVAYGVSTLAEVVRGGLAPLDWEAAPEARQAPDMADIAGHAAAKRAVQVAAAGGHGILMVGPPAPSDMLARRITSIMPAWREGEAAEAAAIWSAAGEDPSEVLAGARPFRAPHWSATAAGLVGGGRPVVPGEASLAHGGVLFLEGLDQFKPAVLQHLCAPLREGRVRIARAEGVVEMPASFMLAASAEPCPCGFFGSAAGECACSAAQVAAYQSRLGGPLADKLDIRIDLAWEAPADRQATADSASLRGAVEEAWERRRWREAREGAPKGSYGLMASCRLSDADERRLEGVAAKAELSGREIFSTLKVARTIADMDRCLDVRASHLAEAMSLRFRG